MIAQLKKGCGFAGLITYCRKIKDLNTHIIDHDGVCVTSPEAICASLTAQAKTNERVKQFVGHLMLAFSPEDTPKLSDEFMTKVAKEYMKRMKITNTQYVIYRHYDQPHGHVHIVYNRVDNDGKRIKSDSNFRASAKITKAITREFDLTFGKGKLKVRRDRLIGKDKAKYRFYDIIKAAMYKGQTWERFEKLLREEGISMIIKKNKDGRIGISFSDGKISFAGSKIDRSLSYAEIDAIFKKFAQINKITFVEDMVESPDEEENTTTTMNGRRKLSPLHPIYNEPIFNEGIGEQSSISAIGEGIVEVAADLILPPDMTPSTGGGGGSADDDLARKKDDEEEENQRPRYRLRR